MPAPLPVDLEVAINRLKEKISKLNEELASLERLHQDRVCVPDADVKMAP